MDLLISFIIPVYNADQYIAECIESILSMNRKDIEIICIDDGSQDQSYPICQKYSLKYAQVKVLHQDNSGVSVARNKGIDKAKGKYIAFVDADDFVSRDYMAVVDESDKVNADRAFFRYIRYINNDKMYESKQLFAPGVYTEKEIFFEQIVELENAVMGAWGGVFKTEFLRNNKILFPQDMKTCEDFMFSIRTVEYAELIYVSEKAIYYYRQNPNSVTANRALSHALDYSILYQRVIAIIHENNISKQVQSSFRKKWIRWVCDLIFSWMHNGISKKQAYDAISKQIYYSEMLQMDYDLCLQAKLELDLIKGCHYKLLCKYLTALNTIKELLLKYKNTPIHARVTGDDKIVEEFSGK